MGRLRCGAGLATIDLQSGALPLEGFTAVHDPLQARVVVLDDGGVRLAFVVVDLTSIPDEPLGELREMVAHTVAARSRDVVVSASHTFSAPHLPAGDLAADTDRSRLEGFRRSVDLAISRAAAEAVASLRPARLGAGSGQVDVNVNRDVLTADGWWLGVNDSGTSDKSLTVVSLIDDTDQPIALLVNYAVQPSIMNDAVGEGEARLVSADLAGVAVREVESACGDGTVALFFEGAAGDQAPNRGLDRDESASEAMERMGVALATATLRVAEDLDRFEDRARLRLLDLVVEVDGQVALPRERVRPSMTHTFAPTGPARVPVWIVDFGDSAFVGVQVELSAATGADIRRRSPFAHTLVATMVNGAAKYLPEANSYDRVTYEAMSSRYARGAAEIVADHVVDALNAL